MATTAASPGALSAPWQWLSIPDLRNWGSTTEERALAFPCDRHLPLANDALYRGVTVEAPAGVLFRWLCQLRVAPYSYDWIDNGGRQSPRGLLPGLDRLEVGQCVMTFFELVEFEPGCHLTLLSQPSFAGRYAVTYLVLPVTTDHCRLVVKLVAMYPPPLRALFHVLAPIADWVMMRKQLRNLKELAEDTDRLRGASRRAAEPSFPSSRA